MDSKVLSTRELQNLEVMEKNATQDKTENLSSTPKRKIEFGNFGNGRYSPAMAELFKDTQRLLGFSQAQAHVTAARFGIDCGRLATVPVSVKVGRTANKDGHRTLKEVTKGVKCPNSWAMSIASVCVILDEARSQGAVINDVSIDTKLLAFVDDAANEVESV